MNQPVDTKQDIKIAKIEQCLYDFKDTNEKNQKIIMKDVREIKKDVKTANGKTIKLETRIAPLEKVVYGMVALILTSVMVAALTIII